MIAPPRPLTTDLPPDQKLPVTLLSRYVLFLSRRPISSSNAHYLGRRLEALRSLAGPLGRSDVPAVQEALRLLQSMNPANFYRLHEQLQAVLLPLAPAITELPRDYVVSSGSPRPELLAGARRLLLIAAPAIGVGDELILFPLPGWLKAANPHLEITAMSAYPRLWDRVQDVDSRLTYGSHVELLDAIRGDGPAGRHDVVVLADFERPDLHPAICGEPSVDCYVELSLGGRSGVLVDTRNRWLHRTRVSLPYESNFYCGLASLAGWLGLDAGLGDLRPATVTRTGSPPPDRLRVYVNAFTSKYDPSALYWSRLLSALLHEVAGPVEVVVDPGTNRQTEAFAVALVRSAGARLAAGIEVSVARPSAGDSMSFDDVFTQMERAHVVVCTDSFTAHAAPIFGCATLVIADMGLASWRVPFRPVYYLSPQADVDAVAAAMRQVVRRFENGGAPLPLPLAGAEPELALRASARRLRQQLGGDDVRNGGFGALCDSFQEFAGAYQTVAERLQDWPAEFAELFADVDYQQPPDAPAPEGEVPERLRADMALHLQDRWQWWQTTNLRKYLDMALEDGA